MRLHVYTICWNERLMLPYFLRHYGQFAERIVVFDNGSDDGSQEIIQAHPRCELREFDSGGHFDEVTVTRIREQAWRESRGQAEWVVMCDMDEFVFHPRLPEYLDDRRAQGVTLSQPQGFQMVSTEFPTRDGQIYDEVRRGVLDSYFSKMVIFDPDAIRDINFSPGSHFARPTGRVVFDFEPELLLLHCKYLGLDYLKQRYQALAQRRSDAMRRGGFGFQYEWSEAELRREYDAWYGASRPFEDFTAWRDAARRPQTAQSEFAPPIVSGGPAPQLHLDSWRARHAQEKQAAVASADWLTVTASPGFVDWLATENVSLAFTSSETGKLMLIGRNAAGQIAINERSFPRCRGLWSDGQTLWMSSQYQLWRFENALAEGEQHEGFDRLFIPRAGYTTGGLDIHDVACDQNGRPMFANTLFDCVATLAERGSFAPLWKPPGVTTLQPEDRCHLTGLALHDGQLQYVTLTGQSDRAGGWQSQIREGGCVLSTTDCHVVAQGLSLPNSPRLYRDRLWLLNSGSCHFGSVICERNEFVPLTLCPGYVRGLAFSGNFAIVGLSLPRMGDVQRELQIMQRISASGQVACCGLVVIDLRTGHIAHTFRIESGIGEISDVAVLPGAVRPHALGFKTNEIERLLTVGQAGTL